jgi:hypothetical protein
VKAGFVGNGEFLERYRQRDSSKSRTVLWSS